LVGKTAFVAVAIIGGGGKVIGFAFRQSRNRSEGIVSDK
jgi:hypothetical protein